MLRVKADIFFLFVKKAKKKKRSIVWTAWTLRYIIFDGLLLCSPLILSMLTNSKLLNRFKHIYTGFCCMRCTIQMFMWKQNANFWVVFLHHLQIKPLPSIIQYTIKVWKNKLLTETAVLCQMLLYMAMSMLVQRCNQSFLPLCIAVSTLVL